MKRTLFTFLCFCTLGSFALKAQSDYSVLLHSGVQQWTENVKDYADQAFISTQETIDGRYYRFLQFYEIPNQAALDNLAQRGIELLEYIPNKAYVASIPVGFAVEQLEALGVRSILTIPPQLKASVRLLNPLPEWATTKNQVELMLKHYRDIRQENVLQFCAADGITVLQHNGYNNFLRVSVPIERIAEIAALPYVAFLDLIPAPSIPDDTPGRSLHRANVIETFFDGGRHYTGEGVTVCTRDDGAIGPHIDFQGRLNQDFVGPSRGNHGDGVSGIFAGGGNLDPRNRGMAVGADLFVLDYDATFLDETMMLFFDFNVIVTNSSYSNGCNVGYTEITETIDQQLYENPTLLHVFSAGNSNNNDCGYGAGNQWGNITGGHKQAKNCVTTANLNADGTIVGSSSRGPAHDGRLKPDIAANGADHISTDENNEYFPFGGTSGAAPGIAGISAMLHHAYREHNGGEVADGSLIKSILLNSTNDLGNPGPDYIFGWGHVNAYRAATTIEDGRFFKATVGQGDINTHTITIPAGVRQARVMVYWLDPPATVMTNKALVNNLNSWITAPDASEHLPWLLDPTADPINLNTPAGKGFDDLNNVEQIAMTNPAAGDYTLSVEGTEVPMGDREYIVVWEFRTAAITLIYPFGGERLQAGDSERLHWDAEGDGGFFTLSYSNNGGANWQPITTLLGDARMVNWQVPDDFTAQGMIRIVRGSNNDTNDEPFHIAPIPQNLTVIQACPDYIRLVWDPAADAISYDVYLLGDKYMEVIGNTAGTTFDVPAIDMNPTLDHWFAVGMQGPDGILGRRTLAINHNSGLLDCNLTNDVELVEIVAPQPGNILACESFENTVTITVMNTGLQDQAEVTVSYQINAEPPVVEILPNPLLVGEMITYTFNQPISATLAGQYDIVTTATVPSDEAGFNNTASTSVNLVIYPGQGEVLDYSEDFENATYPPNYYAIANFDGATTWDSLKVLGVNDDSTNAIFMDNYFYNTDGELDEITTVPLDLSDATAAILTFDVAYARFSDTFFDGLRVEISTDCGFSFTEMVYEKFGTDLATVPDQGSPWFPSTGSQWRNELVNLTDYIGNSIVIKFVSINGYGNTLLIDNINVSQAFDPPLAAFSASNTEICEGKSVLFSNNSEGDFLEYFWDFGTGASPATSTAETPPMVNFSEAGNVTVTLTVSNPGGSSESMLGILVNPNPIPDFTASVNNGEVSFTNNSSFATSYSWDFGDGMGTSTDPEPVYNYETPGTYTVTLIATNDCDDIEVEVELDILVNVFEAAVSFDAFVTPNPTDGLFEVVIESSKVEDLTLELVDLRGMIVESVQMKSMNGTVRQSIDGSTLASGLYFLKLRSEEGARTMKVVIE